jgi:hypothetical protein
MHISCGLLFIWDIIPSFQNVVSVVASQTHDFGTQKIENALFVGRNRK